MNTFDIDLDLSFGIHNRAINVDINSSNNEAPEVSKHLDDSMVKNEENETHSSSTSRVNVERVHVSTSDQLKGEQLSSTTQNERHDSYVEG